jgi:hypothetical protein
LCRLVRSVGHCHRLQQQHGTAAVHDAVALNSGADTRSKRGEDEKNFYQNLIMKIKKEFAERKGFGSIQPLKQLLPLPKTSQEFVSCETYGTPTDSKVFS